MNALCGHKETQFEDLQGWLQYHFVGAWCLTESFGNTKRFFLSSVGRLAVVVAQRDFSVSLECCPVALKGCQRQRVPRRCTFISLYKSQ